MNPNTHLPRLRVLGQGAVFPGGIGSDKLIQSKPGPHGMMATLSSPSRKFPVRTVDIQQPELNRWRTETRLRRASPISVFMAEAASQALAGKTVAAERLGLVCALTTGNIVFSRRFFSGVLQNGRHYASPALFPETVYNSPVSHLASLFGIRGACYTLVGDEVVWVEALRIAQTWMIRGTADQVLVVAGEELDPLGLDAYECAGWFRRGMVAAEGAGALLLGHAGPTDGMAIELGPRVFFFRTRQEQGQAWQASLASGPPDLSCYLAVSSTPPDLLAKLALQRELAVVTDYWGGAFAASTAWDFLGVHNSPIPRRPFRLMIPGSSAAVSEVTFH